MLDLPKDYSGVMRLGRVTDSGDVTGSVVEENQIGSVDLLQARRIAERFIGRQKQTPPMLSALKQDGKRLYELARKGVEVERAPREIEIHSFEILSLSDDLVDFRVVCGRGTYIRTLAADFGAALGPGASVERLHRNAVGSYKDTGAVSLAGEPEEVRAGCERALVPLSAALAHLPALTLRPDWVRRVRHGAQPPWQAFQTETIPEAKRYRLVGPESALVAVASLEAVPGPVDRSWKDSWELRLNRVV
jgi:tRNA pseudouridine55 synthase